MRRFAGSNLDISSVARSPDASRLPGTYLANSLIPLYESPTIQKKVPCGHELRGMSLH
jgi:hypothetical protein